MATKYWVGGNGNWSSTTNWRTSSGGATITTAPGSADAAVLDANSGASVVTVDSNITIQTLTCTGFTGTLAFGTNTISLNSTGTIFTGATTMTVTGTPLIICTNSSATSRTIAPTAVTEANSISFRITAGTGAFNCSAGSIRDIDFTDGTNPTGYAGALTTFAVTIYGNFKASTGMSAVSSANTMTFSATSGTKTINTAGITFDRNFTFDGVGGTFQLASALTSGTARTCTLTNGTLDLNNYTLTTGLFSSNNSNTRVLAFGTGKIVLTGNSATVWTNSTGTGFTYTGTSRIEAPGPATTGTRTFNASTSVTSTEATALSFYITGGSDTVNFTGNRRVNNMDFTGFSGTFTNSQQTIHGNYTISTGMTVGAGSLTNTFASTSGTKTITTNGKTLGFPITFDGVGGTWTCTDALNIDGNTLTMTNGTLALKAGATSTVGSLATTGTNMKYLQSSTAGTQATISDASGTVSVSYLTIQDINATGGATWQAYITDQNVNNGNNTGWDFYVQVGRVMYTRRKNKRYFL